MKRKFTKLIAALALLVFMTPSLAGWGQNVVSGTTYTISSQAVSSLPTGWTGTQSSNSTASYFLLTYSTSYIQTASFAQAGFTSIKLKARKYGGPTSPAEKITVTWHDNTANTDTDLGTISPTSTTLSNYTISSPATVSEGNGYIKICCKNADSNKGSGVSEVTLNFTTSDPQINVNSSLAVSPAAVTDGELSVTYANITPTSGTITLFDAQDNDITSSCTWFTPAFNTDLSKVTYTATDNTTGAVNSLRMHLAVTDGAKNATADVTVSQDFILTTMDQVFARATANGSTEKDVTIIFNNWVISDVNNSNYQYATKAWLTDGTKGCVIFCTSSSYAKFKVNDKLNGKVTCKLKLYTGYAQISSLISGNDGTTATSGLTVTNDGTVNPVTGTTIAGLSAVNTGSVVTLTGLICQSESYNVSTGYILSDGTNTIRVKKNTYSDFVLTQNSTYNVTGVFEYYSSNKYIYPRSAADIIEVTSPVITVDASLSSFTYCEGEGPSAAQTITVSGSNLEGDITLALNDGNESAFEISLNENNNYSNTLTLQQANGTVGETTIYVRMKAGLPKLAGGYADEINLTSTNATTKTVNLTGTVTPPMVTWDLTTATYVTNPAPTTDLIQWSSNYVTMKNEKNGGTNVNNYLGGTGTNADTRMYNKNILTFTPANGYAIDSVVLTTTSSSYINGLNNTKWKNATISVSNNIATAKPTNGNNPIIDTISATIRLTAVTVYYSESTATNYAISIDNQMTHGTIEADKVEATEGATVTLTVYPEAGYYLEDNNIMVDASGVNLTKINAGQFTFAMPAEDVTVYADFSVYSGTYYTLVNSTADLIPGRHYIIASSKTAGGAYAMAAQNSGYRERVAVDVVGNFIYGQPTGLHEVVLSGDNTNYWTLYDDGTAVSSKGYLYASSTSSNNIGTRTDNFTTNSERGMWEITITDGVAAIVSQIGDDKPNTIRYNDGNSRFSCYNNSQAPVYLYMKADETDYEFYSNTTLSESNIITVPANSILTVNAGTLTNANPAYLIIKDGGQLKIYDNGAKDGIQATVEKNITGYGDDNTVKTGWNFIASPITNEYLLSETAMVSSNERVFDLYRLNNTTWENYKNNEHADFTALDNGTGYLYASSNDITLSFAGTIKPFTTTGGANEVALADGWNLVGNPYTFNVYSSKSYYTITTENGENVITAVTSASDYIAPCTGIVVKSTGASSVAFTEEAATSWATGNQGNIQMTLAQQATNRGNATTIDNAIVSFNEGSELEKFYFGTQNANIFIPQGNEEYAIVSTEAQGEMPVSFVARTQGTYTLTVNAEGVEMDYLHLIDNLTGIDTDLLQTPSYTFEASTTDYPSRFRLVFSANDENGATDSETFAYFNGSEWVINNNGNATLQVIDAMGRILRSENLNGNATFNTSSLGTGVYVMRLVNGNAVRTQKIVVR